MMKCLLKCCSVVPDDYDSISRDDAEVKTSLPHQEESSSFTESPVIASATDVKMGANFNSENFTSGNIAARIYFGYPLGFQPSLTELDKLYWWKRYYIFASCRINTSARLERLSLLETYYSTLRQEIIGSEDNQPHLSKIEHPT